MSRSRHAKTEKLKTLTKILALSTSSQNKKILLWKFFADFKNFEIFLQYFFPEKFALDFAPLHRRLFANLDRLTRQKTQGLAVAFPRGHAKTTCVGFGFAMWSLLYRNKNILYFSHKYSQAQNEVRNLIFEMRSNVILQKIYGYEEISPAKNWLEMTVTRLDFRRKKVEKINVRITPVGTEEAIRGTNYENVRPDLVILDDIEKDEDVSSPSGREKLAEWFAKVVVPIGTPATQYLLVGTVLHFHSLLNRILEKKFMVGFWEVMREKALLEKGVAWPARWTLPTLEKLREQIGSKAFGSEFQNQVMLSEDALIRENWLKNFVWENGEIRAENKIYNPAKLKIYMAVDPAISQNEKADYTAICALGKSTEEENYFVLEVVRGHWTMQMTAQKIQELNLKWQPKIIAVESVAYQKALAENLKLSGLPIREIRPDMDKFRRLLRQQGLFEFGKIWLGENTGILRQELCEFPYGEHDDTVDALVYALEIARSGSDLGFVFGVGGEKKDAWVL